MAVISSRTPDGMPGTCPICKQEVVLQPSDPLADFPCPCCGTLIWPLTGSEDQTVAFLAADELTAEQRARVREIMSGFDQLDADSLDVVERIMELEDLLQIDIPDDVAEKLKTLDDFWKWWMRRTK